MRTVVWCGSEYAVTATDVRGRSPAPAVVIGSVLLAVSLGAVRSGCGVWRHAAMCFTSPFICSVESCVYVPPHYGSGLFIMPL